MTNEIECVNVLCSAYIVASNAYRASDSIGHPTTCLMLVRKFSDTRTRPLKVTAFLELGMHAWSSLAGCAIELGHQKTYCAS